MMKMGTILIVVELNQIQVVTHDKCGSKRTCRIDSIRRPTFKLAHALRKSAGVPASASPLYTASVLGTIWGSTATADAVHAWVYAFPGRRATCFVSVRPVWVHTCISTSRI